MENQFSRTELIIGKEKLEVLKKAKVAIFGIGGVGSYVVEGLARIGIGNFILVDKDEVSISNINRQIIATHATVGKDKVEVELLLPPGVEPHTYDPSPKDIIGINEGELNLTHLSIYSVYKETPLLEVDMLDYYERLCKFNTEMIILPKLKNKRNSNTEG